LDWTKSLATKFWQKTLFDIDGRRLLSSGVTLKPSIVQKLHEKNITSIYIHDEVSEGIEIGNIISDETMNCAKTVLREEMQRVSKKHELDLSAVSAVVNRIMDEMLSNRIEVLNVKDIRLEEEKTFAHSLSVCMLSIALASKLSLPVAKIKSIAMGAFLHDIGKAYLPRLLFINMKIYLRMRSWR
jgi:HD-GYP domain-containing protein (c-di-GMP phosphodiesterase class II)